MNRNTILSSKIRPTIVFDVENPEHRYWAYNFINTMSWRDCPYVFALPHTDGDVYSMMCRNLAEWYTKREFDVAKKPQAKKAANKEVDKRASR